ncbi:MAG: hypothetical protein OXI77_03300 [Chloroflexota bacterium]|nr:hypothetical protein [Chloroflexota bacterium]MDE2908784.1 hypothetical protein [Chloroflexota bacterium]
MLKLSRVFVPLAMICLPALLTATVYAADITVNSNCTLADAINAANSDAATGGCPAGSGADTITLTGNITLTAALPIIESEITVEGNGYTISGNEQYQIFCVEETGALTIQNVTLADGRGADDDDLYDEDVLIGGAILNFGSLEVSDSVFKGNSADWGGAVFNLGEASVSISNSEFKDNSASVGGAIYNTDSVSVVISNSIFEKNRAIGFREGGGAINSASEARVTIDHSEFTGNSADLGGAIQCWDATTASIVASTFTGNSSGTDGGTINLWNQAIIEISSSAFSNNSARYDGGAIYLKNATMIEISNSDFTYNSTGERGGAIFNWGKASISGSIFMNNMSEESGGAIANGEQAIINDSTFINSTAAEGGAIYTWSDTRIDGSTFRNNLASEDGGAICICGTVTVNVNISNSIFTGNSAGDEGGAIRGTEEKVVDISHSVFRDNEAEDGGAIYSWGELTVGRSSFINNSAEEEGGAIANQGIASINESILADNPGGDCHLGRKGELLESGDNHISDGTCGATWSGSVANGYCPPGQELDGKCQIGAPVTTNASE